MADKETKSKTSPKAEKPKTAETKSTAKTPAKAESSVAKKSTAATKPAANPAPKAEAKPAAKTTAKPAAEVDKQAVASVVAKHSNPSGRKPLVVDEPAPIKKAPKSKNEKVSKVVEKYSNSRGQKTTIVGDMKERKASAFYNSAPAAEATKEDTKLQTIFLYILIALLVAALNTGVILSIISFATNSALPYSYAYAGQQQVGYYAENLGTVNRYKPVEGVHDERYAGDFTTDSLNKLDAENPNSRYPKYGSSLKAVLGGEEDKATARQAIINESSYLCAWGTRGANRGGEQTPDKYTIIDNEGYLYQIVNGERVHSLVSGATAYTPENYRRLYKHTASVGMYLGDISDDEPGIIKRVTLRNRGYSSYSITGVYAPAGEVIKVELSGKDMEATGGIVIYIGQALYNGQANNIWTSKNQMNRMPHILTTLAINKTTAQYDEKTDTYTAYIGSFIGGPIYIANESATFTVTISGGVTYQHFILGYTTPEEFEQNSKTSCPFFDLEVWSYGVLHSGPRRYAEKFSYDDLYKAAILWEKVSLTTTTNGSKQGIVFLYDPFVAAGAAVAFPGRSSVNCPLGWMSQSLNYNGIVSGGSWGNFHEYHHNFQNYGLGSGADGEVTNNGLNLVSYSLFTKISSKRGISGYGGSGLGGWNSYTSATWVLNRVNNDAITSTNGLAVYATLLHNLGQDQYLNARGASGPNKYFDKWANNTHMDFTYYAALTNTYYNGGSNPYNPSQAVKDANYPLFVPVSSVYQTGRTYMYDGEKREINTMQPYVINFGDDFTVDLNPYTVNSAGQYESGSVVIGKGFTYKIKGFDASNASGTFAETDKAGVYTFTPDKKALLSGKIYVTLEITTESGEHEWNGHRLDDVDLVLEFEQTHAKTKTILERTTYTYEASKMYTDAEQAYKANFAGYVSAEKVNHSNPTQNCNTDVWYVPDTEAGHNNYPNAADLHFAKENTVTVVEGKLFFEEAGKYRVYLRGRKNCAVYYSLDESESRTYELGATIKDKEVPKNSANFRPDDANTYFDIEIKQNNSWMYFKEVLIVENAKASGTSFMGLGVKQWQEPMFTVQEKYFDKNNKEVAADSPDIVRTETKYFNHLGIEVSAEVANNTDPIPPTTAEINSRPPYVNAYRSTYKDESAVFAPAYFKTRSYSYNYADNVIVNSEQTLLKEGSKYSAPPTSWGWGKFPIENVVDGNKNTFIHTKAAVSESSPLVLVFDMGEVKAVNRMVIYSQNRPNGDWKVAKSFTLQGSVDGVEFFEVGNFVDVPRNGANVTVDFEEKEFRYYILTVTKSYNNHIIIGEIEMWHAFEVNGATKFSPFNSDMIKCYGKWTNAQAFSSYGQVIVGSKGANLSFVFEGTRLGVLSSKTLGTNFEVYIDGVKTENLPQIKPVSEQGDYGCLSFLSDVLEAGKHTVTIKCLGEANFDSFVIYP